MSGLRDFYNDELAFQAFRRALPEGAREYAQQETDQPVRRGR